MKKNVLTVLTLFLITSMSGLLLSFVNGFTSERIEKNNIAKIERIAKEVFDDTNRVEIIELDGEIVVKKIECYDANEQVCGYLYQANGSNSFGSVNLLVSVKGEEVIRVDFLSLNQSYGKIAKTHVEETYNGSTHLAFSDVDDVNVKCGASESAKLIKSLVLECIKVHG